MKTDELTGPALDWAVAKCEGLTTEHSGWQTADGRAEFYFSTDWSQGGPIIERERIGFQLMESGPYQAWIGTCIEYAVWPDGSAYGEGPTPLIAAMRCYAVSKLGDEVDVPEELK